MFMLQCNWLTQDAVRACKDALPKEKTVNFVIADYIDRETDYPNVVRVAEQINLENIKHFS
jgi:hypothetical protein